MLRVQGEFVASESSAQGCLDWNLRAAVPLHRAPYRDQRTSWRRISQSRFLFHPMVNPIGIHRARSIMSETSDPGLRT